MLCIVECFRYKSEKSFVLILKMFYDSKKFKLPSLFYINW